MSFSNKEIVFVSLFAIVFTSGCDLLSPKKNQTPPAPVVVDQAAPAQAAVVPASDDKGLPADAIARVGDWTLTVADFNERLSNVKQVVKGFDAKNVEAKKMLVDELIRQQLMVREAREEKIDQSKEVQAAIRDFENSVLVQELASRLTKDIKATEEEAKDYYDKNPDAFVKPVEKKLLEILVPTEDEAKTVLVQVLQGGDFAAIAKEKSKAKTAANGGDLGFAAQAPFDQMQKAVASLSKGGVSAVFQGPDGYYIVKVDDTRGGDKVSFDEVKTDLIKGLTAQKQQQAVLEKIGEVAKKVKVNVNTKLLDTKTGE